MFALLLVLLSMLPLVLLAVPHTVAGLLLTMAAALFVMFRPGWARRTRSERPWRRPVLTSRYGRM